jgi:hypothetical protein
MAKPLKCRLKLHAWVDRENPETREPYQVCFRCQAGRYKGPAAPVSETAGKNVAKLCDLGIELVLPAARGGGNDWCGLLTPQVPSSSWLGHRGVDPHQSWTPGIWTWIRD